MTLLKGVNLTHAYDYTLFNDINITINSNSTSAILGVSGCGKSTLLHILCTLLKPNSGEVFYNDTNLYSLNADERLKIRRHDFGIIFQSHYLFKGFSVKENIELAAKLTNNKIDYEILEKLKITGTLSQNIGELSGGQQQRVSIARVLNKRPRIIFADEPTGNLDKNTANEVMEVIFDYIAKNDGALVLVTHDESLAGKCSSIYRLNNQNLAKI
ncbi:ABC transporter ATP-binding protein [Campylobacter sp. JMF_02 ED1]|uniref:ABC transporter ATP-binding protein n=1 Tax=unclassified Campylobacter TaxID=2593542 RepID=UPI0022E9DFD1|nr:MULTISPECIES: ABC transporter ATP-binding protein [unclassified Campylobacter]MDA3049000.1 ABC transporter ATP-binding protein [Campylobacter sp. JMF_15 NE4]MDA3051575.1 ABC transporter ATP-binding protein [Campylobacter sp. JMF_02 ED1]